MGGNDLDIDSNCVKEVVTEYSLALTEVKAKFPETKLVVAGLPSRHNTAEIRTKVKDYNEAMSKWCETNGMDYINNNEMFEFKSGDIDKSSYLMTCATPAVHLTRSATVRMMENIQKNSGNQGASRQTICWHCGVQGHTKHVCKYERPLQCHSCGKHGHKKRYCDSSP